MMKKMIGLFLMTVMVFSLAACGSKDGEDNSLEYIKDRGKLIMGLDDSFPPMGFRDDANNIVGFDVDLAKAVADKMGVELVLQPIEWTAKEKELNTKSIDCIWNGFSVNPERLEQLRMSTPYMDNTLSLVVPNGSDIKSREDLAGKRLALQSGSSAEDIINTDENKELKASIKEINGFKDYTVALMDLESGNSDAILMDAVLANYMINDLGKDFIVLDDHLVAEQYAIGFRKKDEALAKAVEEALRELKKEGIIEGIATEWFGSDITTFQ